ncbi:MAG: argininosuccinate synthase [Acidobacteriota bacterium]
MAGKRVVLAYSGGLDTVCILQELQDRGYDVVAYVADVGQQEDFDDVARRAQQAGATEVRVENLQRELVTDYIYPAIAGNAVYENRYLLGTALARPVIAKRQVQIARETGAQAVSHGATGKGNDQVRFELAYAALAPSLEIIAPWKEREFLDRFQGRKDLLAFVEERGLEVEATAEKPYSTDENLMHRSYEAGVLEDPAHTPSEDMFKLTRSVLDAPDEPAFIALHFKDAIPVALVELRGQPGSFEPRSEVTDPLELFHRLNELAGEHGVGRIDLVENRFVGIKSRGVYETPAGTVLHRALRDLEGIAMDREVLRLRDGLSPKFTELIYNGFWFSPEMDFIRAAFSQAQELIDGVVTVRLYKGNVDILGRESTSSLYNQSLSSMDVEGGYDATDASGFIRIAALRLQAHRMIIKENRES